jgi:hypothetical protein
MKLFRAHVGQVSCCNFDTVYTILIQAESKEKAYEIIGDRINHYEDELSKLNEEEKQTGQEFIEHEKELINRKVLNFYDGAQLEEVLFFEDGVENVFETKMAEEDEEDSADKFTNEKLHNVAA